MAAVAFMPWDVETHGSTQRKDDPGLPASRVGAIFYTVGCKMVAVKLGSVGLLRKLVTLVWWYYFFLDEPSSIARIVVQVSQTRVVEFAGLTGIILSLTL